MTWAEEKAREIVGRYTSEAILTIDEAVERAIRETLAEASKVADAHDVAIGREAAGRVAAAIRKLGEP